jgi:glycosyltransferase involved in cell wall biosynthesis
VKIALLGGEPVYIARFRGHLLRMLRQRGHEVLALAGAPDTVVADELAQSGIAFRSFEFDRTGLNPIRELGTLTGLRRVLLGERPDLLITTSPKLIAYGGIAARLAKVPRHVALVTGLGLAFERPHGVAQALRQRAATLLLRTALQRASLVVCYNPDDLDTLRRLQVLSAQQATLLLPGSGVDLDHFSASPVPTEPITFMLLGRLVRSKGVLDFVAAAQRVKTQYPEVRFQLVGDLDSMHPHSIGHDELQAARRAGVEHFEYQSDVRAALRRATVIVVPSQQREGMPRVILEAFASGRPVLVSDVPGCRHAVAPGQTGWIVPPQSPEALATAMLEIVKSPARAVTMGTACRAVAEQRFSVRDNVVRLIQALDA